LGGTPASLTAWHDDQVLRRASPASSIVDDIESAESFHREMKSRRAAERERELGQLDDIVLRPPSPPDGFEVPVYRDESRWPAGREGDRERLAWEKEREALDTERLEWERRERQRELDWEHEQDLEREREWERDRELERERERDQLALELEREREQDQLALELDLERERERLREWELER
jgi:hypothetical protein